MRQDLKDRLRTDSNFKFVAAAIVILGLLFLLIFSPRGKDFYLTSDKEVRIGMQICQNSTNWVITNRHRLKLGQDSKLDHIKVNGEIPEFEHLKTPQVIFIASGFDAPNMTNDIFCEIIHPATKEKYYFDYSKRAWTNKVRFRR